MKYLVLLLLTFQGLFATQLFDRCAVCHGKKGEKHSLNMTKSIAGMRSSDLTKILKEYKAGKRDIYGLGKIMQSQAKKLTTAEIKELSRFIEALEPVKIAKSKKAPEVSKDGKNLFKQCAICHGEDGNKKSLNVSKKIAGMSAKNVVTILKEYKSGNRNLYKYGYMMKAQAAKLTGDEMNAIAIYIESLTPATAPVKVDDTKKISKEEAQYNKFMKEYFQNSKNPNETFQEAKRKYDEHQKSIKETNE